LICQDEKESYFSNLTESSSSLTVLCCYNGIATSRTCTGSDCSSICGEEITCIKMVDSLVKPDHCYIDVLLVLRTEDSCKFGPCPTNIGNITMSCKCCGFFSYRKICPECSSSSCSNFAAHDAILSAGGSDDTFAEVFIPSSGQSCRISRMTRLRTYCSLNTVANIPVLCGGSSDVDTQKSCDYFAPNSASGKWTNYATMIEARFAGSGWPSEAGLVIMGSTNTTEIVPNGGVNFTLVAVPRHACTIDLIDSVIITGGLYDIDGVHQYNLQGLVKSLPKLNNGRMQHGCGSYMMNGQRVLIVVGGGQWWSGSETRSTEKYVMGGSNWINVKPIPVAVSGSAFASLDNKVFVLGGHCCGAAAGLNGAKREIYAYDGEDWTTVGQLIKGRWGLCATAFKMTKMEIDGLQCHLK